MASPARPVSGLLSRCFSTTALQKAFVCWKLPGELSTPVDPGGKGRPLLFDRLRSMGLPGMRGERPLLVVAPLEFNAEGVVLLTASSALAAYLNAPPALGGRHERDVERAYRVRIMGRLPAHAFTAMARGALLGGVVQPIMHVREGESREDAAERFAERARRARAVAAGQPLHRGGGGPESDLSSSGYEARGGANIEHTISTLAGIASMRTLLERYGVRLSKVTRTQYGRFHLKGLSPGSALQVDVPHDLTAAAESWAAVEATRKRAAQGLPPPQVLADATVTR